MHKRILTDKVDSNLTSFFCVQAKLVVGLHYSALKKTKVGDKIRDIFELNYLT